MSHIFISHAEPDEQVARDLGTGLEKVGYKAWFYERDSVVALSYLSQVAVAMGKSLAVVVVVSPESVKSKQVTNEIVRAFEDGKSLVPVLYGMTHDEFLNSRGDWRQCFGAAASVVIPKEGAAAVVPRIAQGLEVLGIKPCEPDKPPGPTVPKLLGKTPDDAQRALRQLGLKYVAAGWAFSDNVPKGCVVSQTPEPGKATTGGESVSVVLSKGPAREAKSTPAAWWLMPIVFGWVGGLIAWSVIRSKNPKTARTMLIVGIVLTVVWLVIAFLSGVMSPSSG